MIIWLGNYMVAYHELSAHVYHKIMPCVDSSALDPNTAPCLAHSLLSHGKNGDLN